MSDPENTAMSEWISRPDLLTFTLDGKEFSIKTRSDIPQGKNVVNFSVFDQAGRIHGEIIGLSDRENNNTEFDSFSTRNTLRETPDHVMRLVTNAIGELIAQGVVTSWRSSHALSPDAIKMYQHFQTDEAWKKQLEVQTLTDTIGTRYKLTKKPEEK